MCVCVNERERESSVTTLSGNRTHARALRAYQASMRSLVLACVFLSVIFFFYCACVGFSALRSSHKRKT